MKKPKALRAWLLKGLPDLGGEAERLQLFVDQGRVVATTNPAAPVGFEYRYSLNVVLQDFAGDEDALFVLLAVWLRTHQPELLNGRSDGPSLAFEVDNLGQDKVDLSIDLALTEAVTTRLREDGKFDIVHLDEPGDPQGPFEGADPPPPLAALYLSGQILLPDEIEGA